ncbi:hypothetical protein BT69DRAFT_1286802 [Atractiella rhizophila]|nr:hypothetical protein BT69DRAFT_1286802 [Atractiella rhizophila]
MGGQTKGKEGKKPAQLYQCRNDGAIVIMQFESEPATTPASDPKASSSASAIKEEDEEEEEVQDVDSIKEAFGPLRDTEGLGEMSVLVEGREWRIAAAERQPVIQIEVKTTVKHKDNPFGMLPQQDAEMLGRALKSLRDHKYIDLTDFTDFASEEEVWLISFRGCFMHLVKTTFTRKYLSALVTNSDLGDNYREVYQGKEFNILDPFERAEAFQLLVQLLCYHVSADARKKMRVMYNAYKSL